ncbi:MAG: IS66 family transposase [Clostridia bacterium]|nr:IS66 family transposase [Clostridia bacterium]
MELEKKNDSLSARLNWYEEQFRLGRQQRFGSSSEGTMPDQIAIFNEPEAEAVVFYSEPSVDEVILKPKRKKGHKAKIVNDTSVPVIIAHSPNPVIPKSLASPSLVAHIMTRKYMEALPLYRQEQQFKHDGLAISRQTMANRMIKASKDWLKPLYKEMHAELKIKEVLHADETMLEVLCEPDRPAKTNIYMWMYRTSGDSVPIILYDYREGRFGNHPKEFLEGFKGYLHVDGYAGYNKVEQAKLAGCWAHVRRKYDESLKALPEKAETAYSGSQEGLAYCNRLFEIERSLCNVSFEKRKEERELQSRPILEAYFAWLEIQKEKALPQSYLGKAVTYSLNQKEKLYTFLEDGRIELSNNRGERSIKPFVIGRKNWLFSNTPKGATASAMIYSIIETAKENKLKPFEYLKYLFEQLPNTDITNQDILVIYLPWSADLPDYCRTK